MGKKNMLNKEKKPEIIVFAGPNGSGKSTVTKMAKVIEPQYLPLGTEKSGKFFSPYQADLPLFSVPCGKSNFRFAKLMQKLDKMDLPQLTSAHI